MPLRARIAGLCCVPILLLTTLTAQVSGQVTWDGSFSTFWSDGENWQFGLVPTSADDVVIGSPAPTVLDDNPLFTVGNAGTLEVQAAGELRIVAGKTLQVFGGAVTNDGTIAVNSDFGPGVTTLIMLAPTTLDGSGEVVLGGAGNTAQLNSLIGNVLTHAAPHTIRGEGTLGADLINNGTITADDASGDTAGELVISGAAKTNNGVMRSSAGAPLRITSGITQGLGGSIVADTQKVFVGNLTITGGTLQSVGGGVLETTGNALIWDGVTNSGQLDMVTTPSNVPTLRVRNGLVNDGTINASANAPGASIRFDDNSTIGGNGEIVMNHDGLGTRVFTDFGQVGTFGPSLTVRGVGLIDGEIVNDGTIVAEPKNGSVLEIGGILPKTNNNLMRADLGANLRVRSTTVTQHPTAGQVLANGGTVELDAGGTIAGGSLEAAGAGAFTIRAPSSSGRLRDVTLNAPFGVPTGTTLFLEGTGITNNNTITVNSNDAAAAASLTIEDDLTLDGGGEIVLARPATEARLNLSAGVTAVNAAGHTIRGTGQINGPGVLVNNGRLEGGSASEPLELNAVVGGVGVLADVRIDAAHRPGNGVGAGIAATPLEGEYTLSSAAVLEIEIGGLAAGTEHDQLASTGTVNLSNPFDTLTVLASDAFGYEASPGDRFTIIESANPVNGTFTTVNLPSVLGRRLVTWQPVDYATNPNQVAVEIATVSFFGADFDEDGDVDPDDLTLWKAGFPTAAGAAHGDGDADADGDVDLADVLAWQRQFGLGVSPPGPAVTVPEPGGAACVLVLCVWGAVRPKQRWAVGCFLTASSGRSGRSARSG